MDEYEKLIENNRVFADHIRLNNLSDDEIREIQENANIFITKILSSPELYKKLRNEVYPHLKNLKDEVK